jgi:hypothetical protein
MVAIGGIPTLKYICEILGDTVPVGKSSQRPYYSRVSRKECCDSDCVALYVVRVQTRLLLQVVAGAGGVPDVLLLPGHRMACRLQCSASDRNRGESC